MISGGERHCSANLLGGVIVDAVEVGLNLYWLHYLDEYMLHDRSIVLHHLTVSREKMAHLWDWI